MFIINLTHDVEFFYIPKYDTIEKYIIKILKKRISIKDGIRDISFKLLGKSPFLDNPYDTFDDIMYMENEYNARSTFFFLNKLGKFDSDYAFNDAPVKTIIKKLDAEGWEIALHGSYGSYISPTKLKMEKEKLEKILKKKVFGIRQHYLNLEIPRTFEIQKGLGFEYDASLYPPKYFKKRISKPFFIIDDLLEIPITLLDADYAGLIKTNYKFDQIWGRVQNILDEIKYENGICSILWHTSSFYNETYESHRMIYDDYLIHRKLYQKILDYGRNNDAQFCTCEEIFKNKKGGKSIW